MEFVVKKFSMLKPNELYEILKARSEVFLLEQHIVCQDMDNIDYNATHMFLWEDNKVVAYLRVFKIDGNNLKIGRVLSIRHNEGLGRIFYIKKHFNKINNIYVDAQVQAIGFYQKFGFKIISNEFLDEGIPHKKMML